MPLEQLGIEQCAATPVLCRPLPGRLLVDEGRRAGTLLHWVRHTLVLEVLRELHERSDELTTRRVPEAGAGAAVNAEQAQLVIPLARLAGRGFAVALLRVLQGRGLIEAESRRHDLCRAVARLEGHHAGCDYDETCAEEREKERR